MGGVGNGSQLGEGEREGRTAGKRGREGKRGEAKGGRGPPRIGSHLHVRNPENTCVVECAALVLLGGWCHSGFTLSWHVI